MRPDVLADEARRPRMTVLLAVTIGLLSIGITVAVADSLRSDPATPRAAVVTTTTAPPITAPPTEVPPSTPLATPKGTVPAYDSPNGTEIAKAGVWYGYPMTMPIVEAQGDWLRVMMPERPNQSTAWVRRADVTLSSSAFRIVIRLSETRLIAYQDGFELFSAPVGIGKDATPTPTGSYFVAVIEKPGPHGYGPIVLDLSAHSEAIKSWQGSGDAITAIHGQISAASAARIGTTGTKISNGCIRMLTADQLKLDVIPLGTPVDIVA